MNLQLRNYAGESDNPEIYAVAMAAPHNNTHTVDLPYRLCSWALDIPDNVGIWIDRDNDGKMVAWAVLNTPFWMIDYAFLPTVQTATVLPEILGWVDECARSIATTPYGHPIWFAEVYGDQPDRIAVLEDAGFADQSKVAENPWSKVLLSRSSTIPLSPSTIPDGVTIRPLNGANEAEAYVALHRAAFGSDNMTLEWRNRTLQQPHYLPDLDLVAVYENELVGFCIGWLGNWNGDKVGHIEPMGIRSDFQRRGLGTAILCESLHRLHKRGATTLFVHADNGSDGSILYRSVGFTVARTIPVFRR